MSETGKKCRRRPDKELYFSLFRRVDGDVFEEAFKGKIKGGLKGN